MTSSAKKAAAADWSWKARPIKFLVAPENFSKVRSQRKEWNEVKMSQNGLFLNLGYPTHLLRPLGQPRTPWRTAGQRWQSQRWPVDLIKLLKKKKPFPLPKLIFRSRKFENQSWSMSSLCTQFGGPKFEIMFMGDLESCLLKKRDFWSAV